MKTISAQVRKALAAYPGSLRGLALAAGADPSAVWRFKAGECGMSLETLDKIAPLLGLSVVTKPKATVKRRAKRPAR